MKKLIVLTSFLSILTACSNEASSNNQLVGTWEKAEDQDIVCRDSYMFKGDTVFIQGSKVQNWNSSTQTYEHIGDNDYKVGYDLYTIKVEDEIMSVEFNKDGDQCYYNKKSE